MEEALAFEREAASHLQSINKAISEGDSDIQSFYRGAVVLITGASGFMGKQLLEKLFRSCEIRKIYLLLRPSRGKSVDNRLSDILKDPAYNYLHEYQPDFKQRIVTVEGEIEKLKLGVSDENWQDITQSVTIIFHAAATVKFDEALKTAVRTNVQGTREVLRLAKQCPLLKSFVYISTAYSNVTRAQMGTMIKEEFYTAPISPDMLIDIVNSVSDDHLKEMTPKLTDGWSSTYAFSKAVAEEVVRIYGSGLPVSIIRPAIVIGSYVEPLPGWIDHHCINSINGIGLSCIMGILHVIICKSEVPVNLVPVDYVNNATIASAQAASKRWQEGKREIMIYHVTSERSFRWADCIRISNEKLSKFPSPKIIGDCFTFLVSNVYLYYVLTLLLHFVPAAIVDGLSVLLGKKPWLTQIYKRTHKLLMISKYCAVHKWVFIDKNTQELFHSLSKSDKFIYNFDQSVVDVAKMMIVWSVGMRRYVVKDELKGTDIGLRNQIIFKLLGLSLLMIYVFIILWFVKVIVGLF